MPTKYQKSFKASRKGSKFYLNIDKVGNESKIPVKINSVERGVVRQQSLIN